MKKIALSLMLVMSVCTIAKASPNDAKTSSSTESKWDVTDYPAWAVYICQNRAHQEVDRWGDPVPHGLNLLNSFEDKPELQEFFKRCVEELVAINKRNNSSK